MNKYTKIFSVLILSVLHGCTEYLNNPPEVELTEKEIFGSYETFQGFADEMYNMLVDYNSHVTLATMSIGGETFTNKAVITSMIANEGDYKKLILPWTRSVFHGWGDVNTYGTWEYGWQCIRIANLVIQKLEEGLLMDASEEQYNWLLGQALFFRAYYHYEIVRTWGTIPYSDLATVGDEFKMERHWSYEKDGRVYTDVQAVLERCVEDFEEAALLLPDEWPDESVNFGRVTSLAAKGLKSKALLFSASPLFNEQANGILQYDNEILIRCAEAAMETIEASLTKNAGSSSRLVNYVNGDGLTNFSDIQKMFAVTDATVPSTAEVLFQKMNIWQNQGASMWELRLSKLFSMGLFSSNGAMYPTQMYVDKFEMSDGSRYVPVEDDSNENKRWKNRDKRFAQNFWVHGDLGGNFRRINLAEGGAHFGATKMKNVYFIHKFWPLGIDDSNKQGGFNYTTPFLRLADIYLTYAEAAYEATGSYSVAPNGLTMTAAEAVNTVRRRAGQPSVEETLPNYDRILPNSCESESDEAFRLLYRNERAVELAFEGSYWFDIRRWKRAHLKDGNDLYGLYFELDGDNSEPDNPVDNNSVRRDVKEIFVFQERHYWFPFKDDITRFRDTWEQNPGW